MGANIGGRSVIRVIIGLAILSLLFFLEGNLKYLGLIGLIPLLTGIIDFVLCILYSKLIHAKDNKKCLIRKRLGQNSFNREKGGFE